jgi:hypothetical protein
MLYSPQNRRQQMKKQKRLEVMIRQIIRQHIDLVVDELLKHQFWLKGLKTGCLYERLSDDTDGGYSCIQVGFSPDMDSHAQVISQVDTEHTMSMMHRFRTFYGGGQSPRTRNALLLLAWAMHQDNLEHPQRIPQKKS